MPGVRVMTNAIRLIVPVVTLLLSCTAILSWAYPPAVGVTSSSRNCKSCHADTGPWGDDASLIVDILDARTKASTRQSDGTFLIVIPRGESHRYLTVIGRSAADTLTPPQRNGWAYVDPTQIGQPSLSKFAPGWEIDLPMSCRRVGDTLSVQQDNHVTIVPMTIRPLADAKSGEVELQLMLTSGDSVKNKPNEGLVANYHERRIRLEVTD